MGETTRWLEIPCFPNGGSKAKDHSTLDVAKMVAGSATFLKFLKKKPVVIGFWGEVSILCGDFKQMKVAFFILHPVECSR